MCIRDSSDTGCESAATRIWWAGFVLGGGGAGRIAEVAACSTLVTPRVSHGAGHGVSLAHRRDGRPEQGGGDLAGRRHTCRLRTARAPSAPEAEAWPDARTRARGGRGGGGGGGGTYGGRRRERSVEHPAITPHTLSPSDPWRGSIRLRGRGGGSEGRGRDDKGGGGAPGAGVVCPQPPRSCQPRPGGVAAARVPPS
eukprot:2598956-Rhodomonas_salina.1